MKRNEKWNRQRRTARRDFWRSFPMGLFDLSDWPIKLPFVILYFVGAIWVWGKRDVAVALLNNAPLTSPVMAAILQNIFTAFRERWLLWRCSCTRWGGRWQRRN